MFEKQTKFLKRVVIKKSDYKPRDLNLATLYQDKRRKQKYPNVVFTG